MRRGISNKCIFFIMLGCFAMTSMTVYAQEDETVLDSEAFQAVDDAEAAQQAEADRLAQQLAREERKKEAKQKKRIMESCLTLVRAFYGAQEQMVTDFTSAHPTEDKSRLLSKILAQMMIKCSGEISPEQVAHLQGFKTNALAFDYRKTDYAPMIEIDWESLKYQPNEESDEEDPNAGKGPVELTPEESLMSS
jgi:hypothetical protein